MADEKKKLSDDDVVIERTIGRRSSLARLGAALIGGAALAAGAAPEHAEAQCTDSDPYDRAGRGRHCGTGCTDSDPRDRAGQGRHCARSCSDSDPGDPVGRGRHC
jgi:hypothetical protein